MKRVLLLFIICLTTLSGATQNLISGKVFDASNNEPLDYANVTVYRDGMDEPIDGATTDEDGNFWVFQKLESGKYNVTISFMGYIDQIFSVTLKGNEVSLGKIYLKENSQALGEIEVVGQKSQMRFELDKKVFTVENDIASQGVSISEVLENVPTVEVDQEGNISMRNSEDVEIWINGKPAGLTSDNRADILRQMPADAIKEIELITNPSAKFSPEGTAGIINLVLKEDRKPGYYGSVTLNADYGLAKPWPNTPSGGFGFNLNWNHGIADSYVGIGYNYRNFNGRNNVDRYNFLTDTTRLIKNGNGRNRSGGGMFFRAGTNLRVTQRSTIGISGMGMLSLPDSLDLTHGAFSGRNNSPTHYEEYEVDKYVGPRSADNVERLIRSYDRDESGYTMHPMYNAAVDWQFKINKRHNLALMAQFDQSWFAMDRFYTQRENSIENIQEQISETQNKQLQTKADYEFKLDDYQLGAGWQSTVVWNCSGSDAWNGSNRADHLSNYYNEFINNEQTHAFYFTYGSKFFDRLSLMAGLRGEIFKRHIESTYYSGTELLTTPQDTLYFQAYPSIFIGYSFDGGHELQLNYTRRVDRPRGHQINPRMDFSDSTNISFGNPSLLPSYSSAVELNYLKTWDQHVLSGGLFWRFREGIVQNLKFMDGGTMKNTYVNFKSRHEVGLELVSKNKLWGEHIQLTTSVDLYYNTMSGGDFQGDIYGTLVKITMPRQNAFVARVRISGQFMFTKTFSGQLSARYSSPRVLAQGRTDHSYTVDAGLRKTFLNKKLALTFNVRDIFNSRARRNTSTGDGFWQYQENAWMSRMISLGFSYNFGNQSSAKKNKTNLQSDEFGDGEDIGSGGGED